MLRRRRSVEVFTLSFLDCICCGFGAVILFYTVVSARAGMQVSHSLDPLQAEVSRLQEEVQRGSRGLVVLRNELERVESETASAEARHRSLASSVESREHVATGAEVSLARRADPQQRTEDAPSSTPGERRLEAGSLDLVPPGQEVTSFRALGGDRRYVTGVRMQGHRILILLDVSASMLHEDIVTILRMRNEGDAEKRAAAKWRHAVDTVTWMLTQLPRDGLYQIITFNTAPHALLPDRAGSWIGSADAPQLALVLASLHALVPADGTSLYNAFAAARALRPLPDQIVLVTDGLPTQGASAGAAGAVSSEARARLFDEAVKQLPAQVPVDSILLPMQGDPQAPHRFWHLARQTGGVLLMPAKDWP